VTEKDLNMDESTVGTADINGAEGTANSSFADNETNQGSGNASPQDPLQKELEELKAQKAELEAKLEEAEDKFLRKHADLENFRRRTRLDAEAAEKYRAQSLMTDLLPAIDNFERALKVDADNEQTKGLLQGLEMVYRSLLGALKKEGLVHIEAVGKEFDPHFHQAIMQVEDDNFGSNIVVEEFQKGYVLKDRVIRPSMVKVNQ
jgi:molecular chaperone GrpE